MKDEIYLGNSLSAYHEQPPAREELIHILSGLVPPPNYRVVLSVDKFTEKLVLRVLKRDVWVSKFLGFRFAHRTPNWEDPECEQRRLIAKTYEGMLQQLRETPEFLEFEYEVTGAVEQRVALEF